MNYPKNPTSIALGLLFGTLAFMSVSCNQGKKTDAETAAVTEVDVWTIDEHQINDVPLTSKAKTAPHKHEHKAEATNDAAAKAAAEVAQISKKEGEMEEEAEEQAQATAEMDAETAEEEYQLTAMDDIDSILNAQDYEVIDTIAITEAIIPLDETQTVVAYGKKGQDEGSFQVVSDASTGKVDQIIFTDPRHKDVYNVQAGMSGRDVRKLRREMKYIKRKGKVFLYDDSSNIMYLMDAKDSEGNEITDEDVDNMDVQAIIWKDKKKHMN